MQQMKNKNKNQEINLFICFDFTTRDTPKINPQSISR